MVAAALPVLASFSHLASLRLPDFYGGGEARRAPSPGAHPEEANFSAPLLTGPLLSEIMEEGGGAPQCHSTRSCLFYGVNKL